MITHPQLSFQWSSADNIRVRSLWFWRNCRICMLFFPLFLVSDCSRSHHLHHPWTSEAPRNQLLKPLEFGMWIWSVDKPTVFITKSIITLTSSNLWDRRRWSPRLSDVRAFLRWCNLPRNPHQNRSEGFVGSCRVVSQKPSFQSKCTKASKIAQHDWSWS